MIEKKLLFQCVIPGRVISKKNGTQRKYSFALKRTITAPSDRYTDWAEDVLPYFISARNEAKLFSPINQPVHIRFTFVFENKSGEPDLSNMYEGPQDILQSAGIIANDKLVKSHDGSRKVFGFANCLMIEIFDFNEEKDPATSEILQKLSRIGVKKWIAKTKSRKTRVPQQSS